MDDQSIIKTIGSLVDEEHAILNHEGKEGPAPEHHARLAEIRVTLDQCWDLLRQRRAKREFGMNPDDAKVRDGKIVESYEQ